MINNVFLKQSIKFIKKHPKTARNKQRKQRETPDAESVIKNHKKQRAEKRKLKKNRSARRSLL